MNSTKGTSDEIDKFLELLIAHAANNATDETFKKSDIANMVKNMAHGYKPTLTNLIAQEVNKARLDTISDMIIECYNHDNPIEIAKELENERRSLEQLTNREDI